MVAAKRLLTYADLQEMPDDGNRYEIIGGELIVNPAPISDHQRVLVQLFRLLDDFAVETDAGEVFVAPFDVVLGLHDAVEPDLVFIAKAQGRVPGNFNRFEGAPVLVVEVISPSSRRYDRADKFNLYARSGIPEYWVVDPKNRTFDLFVLHSDNYTRAEPNEAGLFESRVLPGLRIDPQAVFARLD